MKKVTCAVLLAIALLLASPLSGYAGGTRIYFGARIGVGYPHGWVGHPHGWRGHSGWWGPRFYWGGPIVVGPYYVPPPVVIREEPPVYIQPEQKEPYYWYYCQNPQGYYPYVKSCPGGWMKVVPEVTPPKP